MSQVVMSQVVGHLTSLCTGNLHIHDLHTSTELFFSRRVSNAIWCLKLFFTSFLVYILSHVGAADCPSGGGSGGGGGGGGGGDSACWTCGNLGHRECLYNCGKNVYSNNCGKNVYELRCTMDSLWIERPFWFEFPSIGRQKKIKRFSLSIETLKSLSLAVEKLFQLDSLLIERVCLSQ